MRIRFRRNRISSRFQTTRTVRTSSSSVRTGQADDGATTRVVEPISVSLPAHERGGAEPFGGRGLRVPDRPARVGHEHVVQRRAAPR